MASLVGVIVDLSESMKDPLFQKLDKKDKKRSRSIFTLLDELIIKENILPEDKVFTIGFGIRFGSRTADIIGTIKQFQEKYAESNGKPKYSEILKMVLKKLEEDSNFAFRRFLSEDKIKNKIPYHFLSLILEALNVSEEFLENVRSLLPTFCQPGTYFQTAKGLVGYLLWDPYIDVDSLVKGIKEYFLQDEKLIKLLLKDEISVYDYNTAASAFRYWFEGKKIGEEKIINVKQAIEPFMFGKKFLLMALRKSLIIFEKPKYSKFKKYLFVLSDGHADDPYYVAELVQRFKQADVKVVSCYVSNTIHTSIQTKKLYSEEGDTWVEGAKSMFRLSSTIETNVLPYVIFEKAGWSIDSNRNETKLFLQVDHQEHIYEACTMAKKIMSSKDALLELLGSISLSRYIKKTNKHALVTDQKRKRICYAHAVATVFHLAMKRIIQRENGYPDFEVIKDEIVEAFGENGAPISSVLRRFSKKYNLNYDEVDADLAIEAISFNRPVITGFALTEPEWEAFSRFFETNPKGVLTKNDLDITKRHPSDSDIDGGHAVVLTSVNSDCFKFMNSWGEEFGDNGFFRVQNKEVIDFEFFDVHWTDNDLQQSEKQAYQKYGVYFAQKLVEKLRGLHSAFFKCPKCQVQSPVNSFTGNFENAKCPKCTKSFDCRGEGHTLAMNLYLATLLE